MSAISTVHLWRERLVYALLFLFPIMGVSVDHWFSGIYALIFLLSLTCLADKKIFDIYPEERLLLYMIVAYFGSFILSALANGWTDLQTRYLGVEIRYLAVVPLYLMVRRNSEAGRWLLAGGGFAALALAVQAYCDVYELNMLRAQGVYSPNLLGPFAALIAALLVVMWKQDLKKRWYLIPLVCAAIFAVALSGSRGGYLGLLAMLAIVVTLALRDWRRYLAMVLIIGGAVVVYIFADPVKERVDLSLEEAEAYFSSDIGSNYQQSLSSTAVRFEMWRLTAMVFADQPLLGVGRGNYTATADQYVEDEKIHPDVSGHGHPHNAYAETLISRGMIGFVFFMSMLLYPLYCFYRTRLCSRDTALFGCAHLIGMMVFSLTDASTFIKGNFASIFLLYLAVFFSWHVRKVHEAREAQTQ